MLFKISLANVFFCNFWIKSDFQVFFISCLNIRNPFNLKLTNMDTILWTVSAILFSPLKHVNLDITSLTPWFLFFQKWNLFSHLPHNLPHTLIYLTVCSHSFNNKPGLDMKLKLRLPKGKMLLTKYCWNFNFTKAFLSPFYNF